LLLALTPELQAPQDLDSFIVPFLEELKLLQKGVAALMLSQNPHLF